MRARSKSRFRHWLAIENTSIWLVAFAAYIAAAAYLVFHLHYMVNDAVTRVDNAFDVLYSRDPHLGAIGFFWGPLPSFFDLPILAFKGLWPPLATYAFAGSIEAAAFSAGTVVLFNAGLKWAGVVRGMRWLLCLAWLMNPMTLIFGAQGMSEAPFIFFFVASVLVFLKWADNNRAGLLPLLGLLAGACALCRNEALLFAAVMGVAVVVMSVRRLAPGGWRRIETEALMFALPCLLVISLWLGTAAILFRDPLYIVHATGLFGAAAAPAPAAAGAAASSGAATSASTGNAFLDAAWVVVSHCLALSPAVLALGLMLAARLLVKGNRVPGVFLAIFGVLTPAVDIYFNARGFGPFLFLRYQIVVIPFAFLMAVYVLRSLRSRFAISSSLIGLGIMFVLSLSNVATAFTIADPALGQEEWPVVAAVTSGQAVQPAGDYGELFSASDIVNKLMKLDTDKGTILCDSAECFSLNLVASDPHMFLVTSDRTFDAASQQPLVYGVEYFLVSKSSHDRINTLYPGLYETGDGFSIKVGDAGGWRLYRITGPTGRG